MCFSFMYYYPETDLSVCLSAPEEQTFQDFADKHLKYVQSTSHILKVTTVSMLGFEPPLEILYMYYAPHGPHPLSVYVYLYMNYCM